MTEIDALKYELEEERKAFNKLHKKHIDLLKRQGELEKENEQLKEENKQLLLFKNNYSKRRGV